MTPFRSIARLLVDGRPGAHPVAFDRGRVVPFGDLLADVAALLPDLRKAGAGPWLLHTDDSYAALVSLLACAHAGASALLAPNRLPETLARLRGSVVGALVDPGAPDALAGLPCLDPLAQPRAPIGPWAPLDPEAPFAAFLTSGSSGEPKLVPKRLRHLDDEVAELETLFGAAAGEGAEVFASVSHQHVYGLLFRVLWPVAAGRPFARQAYLQPSELLPRLEESPRALLVSSPAHLKRLGGRGGLERARGRCAASFSSGGPLEAESAQRVARALGAAPHEIFGSTETGGVAHRQRGPGARDEAWTPFPSLAWQREGEGSRLIVESPFASVGEPRGRRHRFRMGDAVEPAEGGRFRLRGRTDRVVKIGELRLSLPEMERRLVEHAWVEEARLVPFERGSEQRVHAVAVLSAEGVVTLEREGRRAVGARLNEALAARYDRVLLPRAWRFAAELPRDAQGKTSLAALRALFDTDADAEPVLEAELRAERRGPGWIERDAVVPADLAYLEGHFPGRPLVAGVVQLRWGLAAAAALLGATPRVRVVEALRQLRPLEPGAAFTLRVEAHGDALRLELSDAEGVITRGRFRLAAHGGGG